jgi:2-polyprenyl-3-methyl-5-hydroxy-6-metoxy-1,4-benzoquinol methylase
MNLAFRLAMCDIFYSEMQVIAQPIELTTMAERLLMSLCHDPQAQDYAGGTVLTKVDNALYFLTKTVPGFRSLIAGKVLDFGCGWGHQAVAMVKYGGATEVTGLDLQWHDQARQLAATHGCSDRVRFLSSLAPDEIGTFDIALSCSSMEHFADPAGMVELMRQAIKPGGAVVISFAEPWYGPRGSHFDAFSRLPWVNLLFSERTVLNVRSHFRSDGARRYEDVPGGLNRMSIAKFERIIGASGMKCEFRRVYIAKGLPLLQHVPVARELLASAAACVLRKPTV